MRFCKAHDNEWVRDGDVCIECGGPGERGVHDWGITVTRTADENRALALLEKATGGEAVMDHAEKMRRYRSDPERRARERLAARARGRAMERLAQLHHDEYMALVDEERTVRGLPNEGDIVRKESA